VYCISGLRPVGIVEAAMDGCGVDIAGRATSRWTAFLNSARGKSIVIPDVACCGVPNETRGAWRPGVPRRCDADQGAFELGEACEKRQYQCVPAGVVVSAQGSSK